MKNHWKNFIEVEKLKRRFILTMFSSLLLRRLENFEKLIFQERERFSQ